MACVEAATRRPGEAIAGISDTIGLTGIPLAQARNGALVSAVDAGAGAQWKPGDDGLVTRVRDARAFNVIVNDPAVFPYVTLGFDVIDLTEVVANPANVLLMASGGGVLFICYESGVYEVHTAFLKPDRATQSTNGPYIRNVCLAAYRWMFTHTDCLLLLTRIPGHNRAATFFAPLVGWVKEFERKGVWPLLSGGKVDLTFWSIHYSDWVRKTPDLMEAGKWFHRWLTAEMERLGHRHELHADEDCHDLHVGAAIEMIFGGQLEKAIILYNAWARFAGYGLITLVARTPCLIDTGDALLQITDETFKVLKCR